MKIYNVKIKTMDSDRRVIENGWVEITDGIISACLLYTSDAADE